jgi:hypothetical protein
MGGEAHRLAAELVEDRPGRIAPVRLTLADITDPPLEYFVLGSMLPFGKSSVFFGPSGKGKSAVLAHVAFAFAAGADSLWGLPLYCDPETEERGGAVLIYSAEDTLDDWKRKGAALRYADVGIDLARALERFHIVDKTEGIARLSEVLTVRSEAAAGSISRRVASPTEEQEQLIAATLAVGARLVVVETASRLVEEEDNASFSGLQSALGHIGRETGAAVVVTHHATKAASKDNDSAVESARGGGALVANARNALALFPAEGDEAKPYLDRFPAADLFVLKHGKSTSSTKAHAPLVLVRCDAKYGAVFRLPEEVAHSPEADASRHARMEQEQERERERLGRLYDVVARHLPLRPALSPSWLRDNCHTEIGVPKNGPRGVEALVKLASDRGILKVDRRTDRWVAVALGHDPRRPICGDGSARATAGDLTSEEP